MKAKSVIESPHTHELIVTVEHEKLGLSWVARYIGAPTGFPGVWTWQRWPKMGSVGETMQRLLDEAAQAAK